MSVFKTMKINSLCFDSQAEMLKSLTVVAYRPGRSQNGMGICESMKLLFFSRKLK